MNLPKLDPWKLTNSNPVMSIKGPYIELAHQSNYPEGVDLSLEESCSVLEKHNLISVGLLSFSLCLGRLRCCFRHCLLEMGQQKSSSTRNHLFRKEATLLTQLTTMNEKAQHFLVAAVRLQFNSCEETCVLKVRWDPSPHRTTVKLEAGVSGPKCEKWGIFFLESIKCC